MRNFKLHEETYKIYKNLKKELYEVDSSIWSIDYGMLVQMDNMKKLLIK